MSKSSSKTGQSFLEGALILVVATVVVKIIGAIFKIPISLLLSEEAFGYFSAAYTVFTPLYSLAMAGLPVAVARMVSESAAKGDYRDVKKILRVSTIAFSVTGGLGSIIMLSCAHFYSNTIIATPAAFLSIVCLSPAVFCCCMMSSRRGYYEGLRNMYPTALSQVIEAVAKLLFGLLFAWLVIYIGKSQFENGGLVFGKACETEKEFNTIIAPLSSAAAIFGVTLSTLIGAIYLHIRHAVKGDGITAEQLSASKPARTSKSILRSLCAVAIPVSLGTLATTITTFIDSSSIMNRLAYIMEDNSQTILDMYKGIADKTNDIPAFIFGSYSYTTSIFNLIPTIVTAFAISALPTVTAAWTLRDKEQTKKSIETVLRITSLLALPGGIGIAVLAKPILKIIYPMASRALAVEIAAPALSLLGIAVIFVALITPINSMLQAVGRADVPVKLMLIGGTIKIVTNFILVSIPEINVKGAPVGTILCYIFLFIASMVVLCKTTGMTPNIKATFLKPFLSAAACGLTALLSYKILSSLISLRLSTLISIILAVIIYAICLLFTKTLTKDDIIMLPKGKIFVKILEKKGLIS